MTAMVRQQERLANNLANANTVGYKRDRTFTEALNERLDNEQAPQSDRSMTQWADQAAGTYEMTGNPLDVALGGEGFFVLSDEATGAARYSRAGQFSLGEDGMLRNAMGQVVEGEGGPLQLPLDGGAIEIDRNGAVRVGGQEAGKLRVVAFEDPLRLRRVDGAAFDAAGMEPEDVDTPDVKQGFLEGSNIDPVHEMTEMITHFRLFESQQKTLQTLDQVLGNVTRDLGKF